MVGNSLLLKIQGCNCDVYVWLRYREDITFLNKRWINCIGIKYNYKHYNCDIYLKLKD